MIVIKQLCNYYLFLIFLMYMTKKICLKAYVLLILFAYLSKMVFTEWISISKDSLKFPANAFKVTLYSDKLLWISLKWNGNVNLTGYLFKVGKNLLNKNEAEALLTLNNSFQSNVLIQKFGSGQYIAVVQPDHLNSFQGNSIPFTIQFNSSYFNSSSTGEIHKINYQGAVLNISGINSPNRLRFTSDSSQTKNVLLYSEQKQINFKQNNQICINDPSFSRSSKLLIKYTPAAIYDIKTVSYTLESYSNQNCRYQCSNNFALNLNCSPLGPTPQPSSSNSRSSILPIIIPSIVVPIVLIAIGAIIVYKKCYQGNKEKETKEEKLDKDEKEDSAKKDPKDEGTFVRLTLSKQIPALCCCICLAQNCNSALPCKHIFHKVCIEQWLMKNKSCPMCRFQILRSVIPEQ